MSTVTRTQQDQKVIDRVEAELVSGQTFSLIARANRSARLGGPAVSAQGYGRVIEALGRFAAQGDWNVAAVRNAIVRANPYQTPNEVLAQVAEALADFVRGGYYDVIGATGPEASRPSAHQHDITLRQAILLKMLMVEVEESIGYHGSVPGLGWCVQALMERDGITFPAHLFPRHAACLAARRA